MNPQNRNLLSDAFSAEPTPPPNNHAYANYPKASYGCAKCGYFGAGEWHDCVVATHDDKGTKFDDSKPRLDLISAPWVAELGRVMKFGAEKYGEHNWRKGIKQSRLLAAALRHIFAFIDGEDLDPDSGLSHLAHTTANLMMSFEILMTDKGLDDRFKRHEKNIP